MKIDEFKEVLKDFLSVDLDGDSKVIAVMDDVKVAIKKSYLKREDKLKLFLDGVKNIPNLHKGVFHGSIVGMDSWKLNGNEAYIVIAIGVAYGLWESSPMNIENKKMRDLYIEQDTSHMLPSTTGFNVAMAMAKLNED